MDQHIFLLDTELQCYAALKIVEMENISNPTFFCFNQHLHQYLLDKGYTSHYLDKTTRGWHKRLIRYHRMVRAVKGKMSQQTTVYVARLDLIYTNVVIGTLAKHHEFEVRIIPEGMLNYIPETASPNGKDRHRRWNLRIAYGLTGLKRMRLKGKTIGIHEPLVSTVYCFSGLSSPYPANKTRYIEISSQGEPGTPKDAKSALVVGQPIIKTNPETKTIEQAITQRIKEVLKELGVTHIDYAPHPRDKNLCLSDKEYTTVKHSCLCLEEFLERQPYSIVISCFSTPLLTAKIIFGNNVEAISVGLDRLSIPEHTKNSLNDIYQKTGVKVVPLNQG